MGAWARAALAVGLGAAGASCFSGADALGLPCRSDADCGQDQRCEQGFCGGPPATTTETTTETTTTGPSSTSSESSSSESSTGLDSTTGETTGPLPGCGNGIVEASEDCDPGTFSDEVDCDYDCTQARCGDGYHNEIAGEECDDANDAIVDDCTAECRATLFWDDMESDPAAGNKWLPPEIPVHQYMGQDFSLAAGWQWPSPLNPGTWWSGPYSPSSGTARLVTREIFFPDPGPGFHYELFLYQRWRFDGNPQDAGVCRPSSSDGGVVFATDGIEPPFQVAPLPGQPPGLDNPGMCSTEIGAPDNPLYDPLMPRSAYTGMSSNNDFVNVNVPLPAEVVGRMLRLVFEVGYDCDNCWANAPIGAGWTIESVVIAPVPNPA